MGIPAQLLIVLLIGLFHGVGHVWAESPLVGLTASESFTPTPFIESFDQGVAGSGQRDGTTKLRLAQKADKKPDASGKSRGKAAGSEAGEGVWRSDVLKILAIGMGIGDVTGSGKNEIALIDPHGVYLYRVGDGKMDLVAEYQARTLELKSVDVACVRRQGPCRIYVSAQNRGIVSSFVLEYRNGALVPVVQNVPYLLRVILYPTKGPILLGQRGGLNKIYEGPVIRLEDKGDDIEAKERFGVPLKIPIFGFAIGDFTGKRTPLIAAYDKDDHLRLYEPSGKRLFISQDYYGDSDVPIRTSAPDVRPGRERQDDVDRETFYCRPRIMALDLNKHDRSEVLAIAHSSGTRRFMSRSKMLDEGQVVSLIWNGDALEQKWATPKVQGVITDFAVDHLPGLTGTKLITVERRKTDWLSILRSESQVRAYDLADLISGKLKPAKAD